MRKLGLIGGMSWISTRAYYERINRHVQKHGEPMASAPLLIESLNYALFHSAKQDADWERMSRILTDSALRLQQAGAEGLVIAAVTAHKSYDAVTDKVDIPVLHSGDTVGRAMARAKCDNAAVLGTRFTMTEPFYRDRLSAHGIKLLPPDPGDVELIDGIIYKELMLGRVTRSAERALKTVIANREKEGARAIVLACTELELIVDTDANVLPVFDATEIHCAAAGDWILSRDETGAV